MTADPDLAALYQRGLRDLAARVRADRRLDPADATVTRTSRTCGSSITLDLRRRGDVIEALGWRTRSCTLGMAATAIVVRQAPGRTFGDVGEAADLLRRLLKGADVTFPEPWRDLSMFRAARGFPARFEAIMLPFDALESVGAEADPAGG